MLLNLLTILLTIFNLEPSQTTMGAEWIDQAELCKISGSEPGCMLPVTSTGFGVAWIGEVTEIQFLMPDGAPTGFVKVRVTWFSSEAPYECGQEYKFHMDDLKDVTARSLIVKRCP